MPENRTAAFDYKPGDQLKAQLEIRSGTERFDLIWATPANALYQFEGLGRSPIMKRIGPISTEESAPGVQLELKEMGQLPRLPRLFHDWPHNSMANAHLRVGLLRRGGIKLDAPRSIILLFEQGPSLGTHVAFSQIPLQMRSATLVHATDTCGG